MVDVEFYVGWYVFVGLQDGKFVKVYFEKLMEGVIMLQIVLCVFYWFGCVDKVVGGDGKVYFVDVVEYDYFFYGLIVVMEMFQCVLEVDSEKSQLIFFEWFFFVGQESVWVIDFLQKENYLVVVKCFYCGFVDQIDDLDILIILVEKVKCDQDIVLVFDIGKKVYVKGGDDVVFVYLFGVIFDMVGFIGWQFVFVYVIVRQESGFNVKVVLVVCVVGFMQILLGIVKDMVLQLGFVYVLEKFIVDLVYNVILGM